VSATRTPITSPSGSDTAFGPLRQVDAGLLNVGYVDAGPADRPAVVLLHGWPHNIHSYADVVPRLVPEGYRVLVPYLHLRGNDTLPLGRDVPQRRAGCTAVDVIAFMDALEIERAILAGSDWDARTADIVAALWPERVDGLVAVSGYLIGSQTANQAPLPQRLSCSGGISSTSPPSAASPATTGTGGSSQGSSGERLRRDRTSTTRPSTAAPRRSTTRDTGEAA
jgi:pimeloyl-ACP methyl ester carboxylesterase